MTRAQKLKEIQDHPERHQHTFEDLQRCCFDDGALDMQLMEAHAQGMGTNGGRRCDVSNGPCSCGAWH